MIETSREDIIAITNPNSHSTFQIVDSIPLHPPFILQELGIDFNHLVSSRLSSNSLSKPRYSVPSARPFYAFNDTREVLDWDFLMRWFEDISVNNIEWARDVTMTLRFPIPKIFHPAGSPGVNISVALCVDHI